MQTVKQILRNVHYNGSDQCLEHTPVRSEGMTGRVADGTGIETNLPVIESLLSPHQAHDVQDRPRRRQQRQKTYYDQGTAASKEMLPGDVVRVQRNREWEPALVTGIHSSPRSYMHDQPQRENPVRKRQYLYPSTEAPCTTHIGAGRRGLISQTATVINKHTWTNMKSDPTTLPLYGDIPTSPAKGNQELRTTFKGRVIHQLVRFNDYV